MASFAELRDRYDEMLGQIAECEDVGTLDRTFLEAFQAAVGDLEDKATAVIYAIRRREALVDEAKALAADARSMGERHRAAIQRMRWVLRNVAIVLGRRRLDTALGTVTVCAPVKKLIVRDEAALFAAGLATATLTVSVTVSSPDQLSQWLWAYEDAGQALPGCVGEPKVTYTVDTKAVLAQPSSAPAGSFEVEERIDLRITSGGSSEQEGPTDEPA